jgi:hypothetical protein
MRKSTKIFLSVVIGIVVVGIIGCFTFNSLPDYVKDKNIPKGYVDTDGETFAGKDLTEYYWYKYENKPNFNSNYAVVDSSNIDDVKGALNIYSGNTWTSVSVDENGVSEIETAGDSDLAKSVNEGDLCYLTAYDSNRNEVLFNYDKQESDSNFLLYFYDVETDTLHYIYVVW